MLRSETHTIADLAVTTHTFEEVGDELATHAHDDPRALHISIVAKGEVLVRGDREGFLLQPGNLIEWALNERHSLRAVAAPAVVYDIRPTSQDHLSEIRRVILSPALQPTPALSEATGARLLDYQLVAEQELQRALLQTLLLHLFAPMNEPLSLDDLKRQVIGFVRANGRVTAGVDNVLLVTIATDRVAQLFNHVELASAATKDGAAIAAAN